MLAVMGRLVAVIDRIYAWIPSDPLAVLARIIVGLVFFQAGLTKIEGFAIKPGTFFLFAEEYKVPMIPPDIAAYMVTVAELSLPPLLWAGFLTRLAASALLFQTAVIQIFVYPEAYVTHGLWAVALLYLMTYGAGWLSLDHWIGRRSMAPAPQAVHEPG